MVTILPLHNPIVAAKQIATFDWFSGGRAQVTDRRRLAQGRVRRDRRPFTIGVPFNKRGRLIDECLEAMYELWQNGYTSQLRRRVRQVRRQHPASSGPSRYPTPARRCGWAVTPISAVLRRAARSRRRVGAVADQSPTSCRRRLDLICAHSPGFRRPPVRRCSTASPCCRSARSMQSSLLTIAGAQFGQSAQQVIDNCSIARRAYGVTDTWVNPPPVDDFNAYLDHMAWVAEEVIPKVDSSPNRSATSACVHAPKVLARGPAGYSFGAT